MSIEKTGFPKNSIGGNLSPEIPLTQAFKIFNTTGNPVCFRESLRSLLRVGQLSLITGSWQKSRYMEKREVGEINLPLLSIIRDSKGTDIGKTAQRAFELINPLYSIKGARERVPNKYRFSFDYHTYPLPPVEKAESGICTFLKCCHSDKFFATAEELRVIIGQPLAITRQAVKNLVSERLIKKSGEKYGQVDLSFGVDVLDLDTKTWVDKPPDELR